MNALTSAMYASLPEVSQAPRASAVTIEKCTLKGHMLRVGIHVHIPVAVATVNGDLNESGIWPFELAALTSHWIKRYRSQGRRVVLRLAKGDQDLKLRNE